MSLVLWSDEYLVGDAQIDTQHRYLFDLINAFHDAFMANQSRKEVARLLNQLTDYAETHFQEEERLMHETGYPAAAQHHAIHEALYEQIYALNEKFEDRALNPTYETIAFLRTWLAEHILKSDIALGQYLKNRPQNGAAGERDSSETTALR